MIDAVIIHSKADAQAAHRLAAAWPGERAAIAEISTGGRAVHFGPQVLICAIWTGAANDHDDGAAMAAALATARRRGVVLLWRDQSAPDLVMTASAPILEAEDGAERDGARLFAVAQDMSAGRYLPAGAQFARTANAVAPKLKKRATPEHLAAPTRRSADAETLAAPDPRAQRTRKQLLGFALGAGLGAALFFGFAVPRLSAWISQKQAVKAPPSLLHTAAAHPAAVTVIAPAVPAPAAPPVAAPPPVALRGLSDVSAAQSEPPTPPAPQNSTP